MGKLENAIAVLNSQQEPSAPVAADPVSAATIALLEKMTRDKSVSNSQLANALGKGLDAMHKELNKAIGAIDGAKDRGKLAESLNSTRTEIKGLVSVLERSQTALKRDIEVAVKALSSEISGANARDSVEQLKAAIQAVRLPESDFTPVIEKLDQQNEMLQRIIMQNAENPEQWSFEVQREDFSDKITSVTATRTT